MAITIYLFRRLPSGIKRHFSTRLTRPCTKQGLPLITVADYNSRVASPKNDATSLIFSPFIRRGGLVLSLWHFPYSDITAEAEGVTLCLLPHSRRGVFGLSSLFKKTERLPNVNLDIIPLDRQKCKSYISQVPAAQASSFFTSVLSCASCKTILEKSIFPSFFTISSYLSLSIASYGASK